MGGASAAIFGAEAGPDGRRRRFFKRSSAREGGSEEGYRRRRFRRLYGSRAHAPLDSRTIGTWSRCVASKIEAAVRQNAGLIAEAILAGEGEEKDDDDEAAEA